MVHCAGFASRSLLRVAVSVSCILMGGSAAVAGTPPPGFLETQVVADSASIGAASPSAVAYEPGTGDLWVLEKGDGSSEGQARVRRRDAITGEVTTALDLQCVDSRSERGLLGIAFSPDYLEPGEANRHVYLYYTRRFADSGDCSVSGQPQESRNRVSRFTESGGILSGEQLVLDCETSARHHNGGTLRFAPDGTLFISIGDSASQSDPNPLSRDLSDLRGKLLRIHDDGSIPADNPFVGVPGVRGEIWAWGLRNPFRFSIDAETGAPVIGDVGQAVWEAIYVGVPGADYGYPCLEGAAPFLTCNPAPAAGSITMPAFVYGHANETSPVSGNSVTGGPVYRAGAFPEEYEGTYFFGDYVDDWIRRGRITPDGRLVDVEMFMPNANGVVDMVVSPQGCLAWVSIVGSGVREVCYVGGSNGQPHAEASANPLSGLAPLDVQLTGSLSSDPDGDVLQYSWDPGEGPIVAEPDPAHTYTADGVYEAVLTVDDQQLEVNSVDVAPAVRIVVGNDSPSASIDLPGPGATYDAGSTISFAGSSSDPQDGVLPPDAFSWTVVFHHGEHTHPFAGPLTGISAGQFTVPASGEDATDVFFRVHLRVTDSGAPVGAAAELSSSTFVDVSPNVSTIGLAALPAGVGLELELDRAADVAPFSGDSVVNFPRTLGAPSPQAVSGMTFEFVSWSDGGAREHGIDTPATSSTFTAQFACVASCGDIDSDGDGVRDTDDPFPGDASRPGPVLAQRLDAVEDVWKTVALPYSYLDPVIILGPPTASDPERGVARLGGVSGDSFDVRFQEWDHLDGVHGPESIPCLVVANGRHVMDDGSIWEAGVFTLSGTGYFKPRSFSQPFPGTPELFLTVQTYTGAQTVTVRARRLSPEDFEVSLFEEEALMNGHIVEHVGYLAVYSPAGSGVVKLDGFTVPYAVQQPAVGDRSTPVLGWSLTAEEDQSLDPEVAHVDENVSVLAVGRHLFAQDVSSRGANTIALRRVDPVAAVAVEWGTVDGVNDQWTVVPLANTYSDPVVIVKPVSSNDAEAGVVRLRKVKDTSFEVRFQEWDYLDGSHGEERLFYMVADAGQHTVAGLSLEAGTLELAQAGGALDWNDVTYGAPFTATPGVFAALQTHHGHQAVLTRVRNAAIGGFEISLQEEEAAADGHVPETVGWIAIETGNGVTANGRTVNVLAHSASNLPSIVDLGTGLDGRYPIVVADMVTTFGRDPCFVRYRNLTADQVELYVQEERSLDVDVRHADEQIVVLAAE